MLRSKIKGMLVGGAIGDALGMGVETWTPEKIKEVHGENGITKYEPPIGHKWFTPESMPAGSITDDTQLTVATMKGLIAGHKKAIETANFDYYMDAIAAAHVEAMKESTAGWGNSTVEAIRRIANGVHWSISGKTTEPNRGTGNGIPMKCSPLGAWAAAAGENDDLGDAFEEESNFRFFQRVVQFGAMTHYTKMAAESGVLHCGAIAYCLNVRRQQFDGLDFCGFLTDTIFGAEDDDFDSDCWTTKDLVATEDQLRKRIERVARLYEAEILGDLTVNELRALLGNGSCYVYDSLPFSYAFFFRNLDSFQTILDVVNAGGDTDTNAKLVGEMIGALNGIEFFQKPELQWAIDGLPCYQQLVQLGDEFCNTFGIK